MIRWEIKIGDAKWSSFWGLPMTHGIMFWSIWARKSLTMEETRIYRIWVSAFMCWMWFMPHSSIFRTFCINSHIPLYFHRWQHWWNVRCKRSVWVWWRGEDENLFWPFLQTSKTNFGFGVIQVFFFICFYVLHWSLFYCHRKEMKTSMVKYGKNTRMKTVKEKRLMWAAPLRLM